VYSTASSEKETVTCRVSLADGTTLEVTTRDITALSALLRNLGLTRETSISSASPATSTNQETPSNTGWDFPRELVVHPSNC